MNKKIDLYNISKSRAYIMGIATLMIVLFHSNQLDFEMFSRLNKVGYLLNFLKTICNSGVEIFLIMSGVGLYFSFSKNDSLKTFYKKRLTRILPSVLIIISIYYFIVGDFGIKDYLTRITLLQFFIDGTKDFWYFSFLLVLYLIFPVIFKIINKYNVKGCLFLILFVLLCNYLLFFFNLDTYKMYEVALTRFPSFIIGVYLGKQVYNENTISYKWLYYFILLLLLSLVLCFIVYHKGIVTIFWARYLKLPIIISLIFLFSCMNFKPLNKFIIWIGGYSMEIYLTYEYLGEILIKYFKIIDNSYVSFYLVIFIISLIFSIILKKVVNEINENVIN